MIVLAKIILTLILVVWLLRKRVQIGHAMLAGSVMLFLIASPTFNKATTALRSTLFELSTWEVMLAMFFVMCLEHLLRTSGTIDGLMTSLKAILRSDRVLLAFMPAFLGLLPSLGGAIFSAPMVEHAGKKYPLTAEDKITINYWFRHIWEYGNPIVPAMILASQITAIPLGSYVTHMIGYMLFAFILGWIFILSGKKFRSIRRGEVEGAATLAIGRKFLSDHSTLSDSSSVSVNSSLMTGFAEPSTFSLRYILLALGPILVNIFLVVGFHLSAALSMGLVVLGMVIVLRLSKDQILKMLLDSFDKKLQWGILSIMLFQHVLTSSGLVQDLVNLLQGTDLPIALMIGLSALLVGILTGVTQGFVAVIFPIVAALAPGNISTASTVYLLGVTGCMLSPAHLCLIVTGEYFKGDIFKSLRTVLFLEIIIVATILITQFM